MIPKKLHFIWVGGGKKSAKMLHCIESWRKFCPDYEIIEWNENNFDVNRSPMIKKGLERRNWALAADAMRIFVLHEHGGIYLDTDMELLKPIDDFLRHDFFVGYESKFWANTAIIGSVKGHPMLGELCRLYEDELCLKVSNLMSVHMMSALLKNHYNFKSNGKTFEHIEKIAIYARDWFYPQSYLTHRIKMTENSHGIHYYSGTWGSEAQLKALKVVRGARFFYYPVLRPLEWITARSYRFKVNRVLKKFRKQQKESN